MLNVTIMRSGYSSLILEISKVPIPDPVPPPIEWHTWKPVGGSTALRLAANNRVDDLQGMVSELQQARREGWLKDVALLEEQMHQMLREWKAELREASPACSARPGSSHGPHHGFGASAFHWSLRLCVPRQCV